ncbi:unnamed protein product, partial [Prorocentrum cordatum]
MTDATQFAEADKTLSMGSRTAHQLYLEDHLTRLSEDISSTTKRLELEKRRLNKLEQDVERTRLEHQEKVLRLPPKGVKKDDKEKAKKEQKVESVRTLEHRKMQAVAQLDALENENKEPADPGPHRLHAPREDADESDLQEAAHGHQGKHWPGHLLAARHRRRQEPPGGVPEQGARAQEAARARAEGVQQAGEADAQGDAERGAG